MGILFFYLRITYQEEVLRSYVVIGLGRVKESLGFDLAFFVNDVVNEFLSQTVIHGIKVIITLNLCNLSNILPQISFSHWWLALKVNWEL